MGSKIFNRPDDMVVAKGLLETCVHMYRSSRTHLAPESWGTAKVLTHYDPFSYGKPKRTSQNRWQIANDIVENKRNRTLPNIEETPSGVTAHDTRYLLRPETIESLYIMYRITGDPIYQEYGWLIYEALETHCKTESAYAVLKDVNKPALEIPIFNQIDSMET
jgi:mannosyl-oligosaccharide alpha-1,2-mannosidase